MDSIYNFDLRDEFQRKKIATNIIEVIKSDINISPLVIDGDWGTGKTEFSLKLMNLLKNEENMDVVYIDAFKEDHADSPILSITAAIAAILPPKEKSNFISKSIPAIKFGLKTTFKAGTAWVLKQDSDLLAEDFKDAIEDVTNAAIDNSIEKLLTEHIDLEKNISTLKNTLEIISINKKIIIITDELDRCRPNYAVSFLEKIKHIFDTNNIVFILIANMRQLRASISHAYGASVDAKKYLDKFVNYTINLPSTLPDEDLEHNSASVLHWQNLVASVTSTAKDKILTSPFMDEWIYNSKLSLRETETFFRHFLVFVTISKTHTFNDASSLDVTGTIMGVYLHCFCSRETIENFPTIKSIHEMADTLGLKTFIGVVDKNPRPLKETAFYLYVRDHIRADTYLNPPDSKINFTMNDLARSIYGTYENQRLTKIINNTYKIMSFTK